MNCRHCGKTVVRTNWYDGPGWNHATGGPACKHLRAEPEMPACAACDKPVEILPSGVMVHPDGTGHTSRRSAVPWPVERPYEHVLSDDCEQGDLG